MNWLKENWFKLALVLVIPITSIVLVYGFVIYPESIRQTEKYEAEQKIVAEKREAEMKEELKAEDLKSCLDDSDSQKTYAHLSYCGQDSRSPKWCTDVFGGAKDITDVMKNFRIHSPSDDLTLDKAFDQCNCSLEGWIREGFDNDKAERDKLCYALHS